MTTATRLTDAASAMRDALLAAVVPGKTADICLDAVVRAAQRRDVPYAAYHAAYGVAWAIQTGRVSGQIEAAVKAMPWRKLAALLARLATECDAADGVPRRLIEILS